jgi:FkbH-like protein
MSFSEDRQAIEMTIPPGGSERTLRLPTRVDGRSIHRFLAENRAELARALLESADDWDRASEVLGAGQASRRDLEIYEPSADYLTYFFDGGDVVYRQLFVGELLKTVHSPDLDRAVQQDKRDRILSWYRSRVAELAEASLEPVSAEKFLGELDVIIRTISMPAEKTLNLLFIGDCLTLDIMTFLAGPCRENKIDLNPVYLTSFNPVENRKAILKQPKDGFSLVFYSPFSYTFTADYSQTLTSSNPFAGADSIRRMIDPGFDEVRAKVDLLSNHFSCPVIVHNSTNVRRHDSKLVDRLKAVLSRQARRIARREANWFLEQYVKNLGTSARVSILDEHSLLADHSEWELGRRFYNSEPTHPTVLSRHLAGMYSDYVEVAAALMTRKLVVCDLDNTLWEGEIGEGKVTHFASRQATLKRLRTKGVLLAINSKNDPRNVHWEGSSLDERDFVASRINWNSKVDNMREIRDTLNLKTKDFVFIDDRPDQREVVSASFPEILSLDATDERSWRLLDLWSRLLPEQDDIDRTQLYHERSQRESFLSVEAEASDPAALLTRLGLKATLRLAKAADLKRAAELINRTNQFNLMGSRTSQPELKEWIASPDRWIFLVDGADKFGQMGVICVALAERAGRDVTISSFVLSCRVFGYGFESAVLNAIAKMARRSVPEGPRVVGLYRETPLNEPCRSMYPSQGYAWDGERWVLDPVEIKDQPAWLEVVDQTQS